MQVLPGLVSHTWRNPAVDRQTVQKHVEWCGREGLKTLMIFNHFCSPNLLTISNREQTKTLVKTLELQNTHKQLVIWWTNLLLVIPPTVASKCSGQANHLSLCVHCWCLPTLDHKHSSLQIFFFRPATENNIINTLLTTDKNIAFHIHSCQCPHCHLLNWNVTIQCG